MADCEPRSTPGPRSPTQSREFAVRRFGGAHAARIVDSGPVEVAPHAHDWPVLSLYVSGDLLNRTEIGAARIASPGAVFYRGGDVHANRVAAAGFEQIQIEFDPVWAGRMLPDRPRRWIGGRSAAEARSLARLWRSSTGEDELAAATARFFALAGTAGEAARPPWIDHALAWLRDEPSATTRRLARELGLSPAWLAESWRRATGEGLPHMLRRRRVETAAGLLRTTAIPAAQVAAAAGFCDQSHMSRAFRIVLGRTPGQVRAEWQSASV